MKRILLANRKFLVALLLVSLPVLCRADSQWALVRVDPHLSRHPTPCMHVDGTSHAAKGKGVCHAGECDFLIAAPVNSFNTGDSNRDLHMLEVTRGAQFPMVIVRTQLPENSTASGTIYADLVVQFAGQTPLTFNHVTVPTHRPRATRSESREPFPRPVPTLRSTGPHS